MARRILKPRVTFDAQTHTYRVEGHEVPSVTTIIKAAGLIKGGDFYTDEGRRRGRAVHEACMNIDLGVPHGCPAEYIGYVDSYQRWREFIDHEWERIEEPGYNDAYGVVGTPDRVGRVKKRPAIGDLKTGGLQPWHPLQFALYDLIHDDMPPRMRDRIGIYLNKDGRCAQMLRFQDPTDYDRALIALRRATA